MAVTMATPVAKRPRALRRARVSVCCWVIVVWPFEKGRIIRIPILPVENELPEQASFSTRLIAWQKREGRHDLPWQQTRDPYRVWLSEIMLQQTQVATVIPYYQRFLSSFPDLTALAAAPIEAVVEHWAGLGYYARARNLHRCAQQLVTVNAGKWPKNLEQLAELPGIGRSTAAAIAAFAFGQRAAILDGNVKRVLCRHFAIDDFPAQAAVDRKLWALANDLLPDGDIEAYTQGLMDLGATLCTRSKPHCLRCPLAETCLARQQGRQAELPVAKVRAAVPERRSTFVIISDGQRILLERRPPSGIWGGLLVPPEGEAGTVLANLGLKLESAEALPPMRHAFTHFRLTLEPILCLVTKTGNAAETGMEWVALAMAGKAGVPTPIRKLLKQVASARD